jgi:hypothetical protein
MADVPMSDERLAEIEAEHADPDHYEESTSCSALELIAEIRRLKSCTCTHSYPCPVWAGYRQAAWTL